MEKKRLSKFLQPFLGNVDRIRAVNTEAVSQPQYFTSLTENDESPSVVVRTFEYLLGVPSEAVTSGKGENKLRSTSQRPVNILNAVIRSVSIRRRCKERRPSRYSLSW